jgi:hypothetical protein
MRQKILLGLVFLFATVLVGSTTWAASACTGCTPGYWKQAQHFGSWTDGYVHEYSPGDTVSAAFGCGPEEMTLLEALSAKGGQENALLRHATAALLNTAQEYVNYPIDTAGIQSIFCTAWDDTWDYEGAKNYFAERNERFCPLGRAEAE